MSQIKFYASKTSAYLQLFFAAVVLLAAYVRLESEASRSSSPLGSPLILGTCAVALLLALGLAWPAFRTLILRTPLLEADSENVRARTYWGTRALAWTAIRAVHVASGDASLFSRRTPTPMLRFETIRKEDSPLLIDLNQIVVPLQELLLQLQVFEAYRARASESLLKHTEGPLFSDDVFLQSRSWKSRLSPRWVRPLVIVAVVVIAQFAKKHFFNRPIDLAHVIKTQVAPDLCRNEHSIVRGCYTTDEATCRTSLDQVVDVCVPELREAQAKGLDEHDENQFMTLCLQKHYLELNADRVLLTQQCTELQGLYAGHDLSWLLEAFKAQKRAQKED